MSPVNATVIFVDTGESEVVHIDGSCTVFDLKQRVADVPGRQSALGMCLVKGECLTAVAADSEPIVSLLDNADDGHISFRAFVSSVRKQPADDDDSSVAHSALRTPSLIAFEEGCCRTPTINLGIAGRRPREDTCPSTPVWNVQKDGSSRVGPVGFAALSLLVLQNSALTLTMRASRLPGNTQGMYLATSAVVVCELIKLMLSVAMLVLEKGVDGAVEAIRTDILSTAGSNLALLVPATMYTLQNNLQYYAAGNLDPATFQVLYQMKLITTAILSVVVLKKTLTRTQWLAIVVLSVGIALVQTDNMSKPIGSGESQAAGFAAVLVASCTSAVAGVFLEKIVKQTAPSVWIRNIQLALFGLLVGGVACRAKDSEAIAQRGFLQGFNATVWVVVFLQSFGGILIAVVVKYTDNILKGFATGLSIIMSAAVAIKLFDFQVSAQYFAGAFVVVVSVYLYSANGLPSCFALRDRSISPAGRRPTSLTLLPPAVELKTV
eukprot:Rhum_TRINITY_DN18666_c0_g1::Rhum_TRINITY_DN18666_c0_g1_i1::g.168060::m.168060/K15272/SLC35A1_2_3; solute carrier family 35 (UDP-sugar transporter), member A1/2/3